MTPAFQDRADIQRLVVSCQQVEPLRNRLQHSKFDSVMDELDEMSGARGSGMDESTRYGESADHRLDLRYGWAFTTGHEGSSRSGSRRSTRSAEIDEIESLFFQSTVAAN